MNIFKILYVTVFIVNSLNACKYLSSTNPASNLANAKSIKYQYELENLIVDSYLNSKNEMSNRNYRSKGPVIKNLSNPKRRVRMNRKD